VSEYGYEAKAGFKGSDSRAVKPIPLRNNEEEDDGDDVIFSAAQASRHKR